MILWPVEHFWLRKIPDGTDNKMVGTDNKISGKKSQEIVKTWQNSIVLNTLDDSFKSMFKSKFNLKINNHDIILEIFE